VGRILGLDYGKKRIGVSISDPLGLSAQPVATWTERHMDRVIEKIDHLCRDASVSKIVIGLPLTLKGEMGQMAQKVERFRNRLTSRVNLPIVLWDERLTSVQATSILHKMGMKPSRDKEKVDRMAAVLILQNYLDHQHGKTEQDHEGSI